MNVCESLEAEAVHPPLEQSIDLPPERRLRLRHPQLAERLDPDTEGPDGAEDEDPVAAGIARQPRRGGVELLGFGGEAVLGQLQRVGAEGVGLEQLGPGLHVFAMDLADQFGRLEAEFIVADVEEGALGIEHRSHRAVDDVHAAVRQQFAEIVGHGRGSGVWSSEWCTRASRLVVHPS